MGGARAVRIPYNATENELDNVIENVNGIFFMGGDAELPDSARYVVKSVTSNYVDANDAATLLPLWGTCLGFEWLLQCAEDSILSSGFDSENVTLPLMFTPKGEQSRMYNPNTALDMVELLKTNAVTMNNHRMGVKPSDFAASESLRDFNVLSTNKDRKGVEFVSSFEHKMFPIYGTQYHPEKSNFEYGSADPSKSDQPYEVISHSPAALRYSFELANLLVFEAAKSGVRYDPVSSGLRTVLEENDGVLKRISFEESYLFKV